MKCFKNYIHLSSHFKDELPFEVNSEDILNLESMVSINCDIEETRVSHFFIDSYRL